MFCLSSVAITPEAGTVDPSFSHDAELPPQESKVGSEDSMRSLGIKESGETVDTEELSVGGENTSFDLVFCSRYFLRI